MTDTLLVIEKPGGREQRVQLKPGEYHKLTSDGPVSVAVYAGEDDAE